MRHVFFCISILLNCINLNAQGFGSYSRDDLNPLAAPFYHGVASGDPTSSTVILWTRLTLDTDTAEVNWQVSADTLFTDILASGDAATGPSRDFTIKVKAENLPQNAWLYYRFSHDGIYSPIGRTRTAPENGVENLRFAVMACSNYQDGYFNAYRDAVNKNDVDAIIHLGDYIYEYGIGDFSPGTDTSRLHEPDTEILNLEDYRIRHSHYKLDADLQEMHRQYPIIAIWDDHETANNSWMGGAENHTEGSEGAWEDRKNAGIAAYYEWMPVDAENPLLRRAIDWGNLVDLILLDTRLEGREVQAGTSGALVNDTARTLLGTEQLEWFKQQLSESTAQWKIIGNQVMVAPLRILGSAVNEDQWDGYPAERNKVLSHIENNAINNCVFLTGDIHTSWGNDVPRDLGNYNASSGAGSVAVEFVCTSVTSSSFLTFGVPTGIIQVFNPYVKYAELSKRGYVLLDITQQRVQGDWVHLSTITSRSFTSSVSASRRCNAGENHLETSPAFLTPRGTNAPLAPTSNFTTVKTNPSQSAPLLISIHPNPAIDRIALQFHARDMEQLTVRVSDAAGSVQVIKQIEKPVVGLNEMLIPTGNLKPGVYIVSLHTVTGQTSMRFVKVD